MTGAVFRGFGIDSMEETSVLDSLLTPEFPGAHACMAFEEP